MNIRTSTGTKQKSGSYTFSYWTLIYIYIEEINIKKEKNKINKIKWACRHRETYNHKMELEIWEWYFWFTQIAVGRMSTRYTACPADETSQSKSNCQFHLAPPQWNQTRTCRCEDSLDVTTRSLTIAPPICAR